MPFSDPTFDNQITDLIKRSGYRHFLDIGCGAGKYGQLIRSVSPDSQITALEPDKTYIKDYGLKKIYNKIIIQTVEDFTDKNPDFVTEMAIFGDCLEHLKKSDGIDVLNFLIYRTKLLVVVFPSKFIQLSWQGHNLEAHRSVWSKEDFINFEHEYVKRGHMNLVVIRGYLDDPEALAEVGVMKSLELLDSPLSNSSSK